MAKSINIITNTVIGLLALLITGNALYNTVSPNSLLHSSKENYATSLKSYDLYNKRINLLTRAKVENALSKDSVNLDDAKKSATDRVNAALKAGYSNVDKDSFADAKKELVKQVGSNFGTKIANLINPNGSIPYSNNIEDSKVAFGRYNQESQTMPMVITVKYKATGSSNVDSNDYWTVNYNVKNGSFSKANHQSIIAPQTNN